MIPLEDLQRRLKDEVVTEVAAATGLHYNSVRYIRDGQDGYGHAANPTLKTWRKLSAYFEAKDAKDGTP